MGFYIDRILPRCMDRALNADPFNELRPKCIANLKGRVLEIGFGSGLNLPFYSNEVTEILALEPAMLARQLAQPRIEKSSLNVRFIGLDAMRIPLDDESVDFAVSTWTLCTVPVVDSALAEIQRVLKGKGRFHFLEHGRAPDRSVSRWQQRLCTPYKYLNGGCVITRKIDELIEQAGFSIVGIEKFYMKGPKFMSYIYLGYAEKA